MAEALKQAVILLSMVTEAISAVIIGIGVLHAAVLTALPPFGGFSRVRGQLDPRKSIRLRLGRWLALEFQLAADILKTAVTPTWDDIGKVGAIIGCAPR